MPDPKAQIAAALGLEDWGAVYERDTPEARWVPRCSGFVFAALEEMARRGWRVRINDIRSSNGRGTLKGYVVRLEGRDRHGYHAFGKGEYPDLPTAIVAAIAAALKGDADA